MNSRKIDKIGRFVVDILLLCFLLIMLALPVSTFSIMQISGGENTEVLSAQDVKNEEENKTYNTPYYEPEFEVPETTQSFPYETPNDLINDN